jgi:cytochrome c biogenesis protein CcmG, thiol:disulfide interchange protein DsbE
MWRYFVPAGAFLALGGLLAFALVRIGAGKLDVHEIKSPLLGRPAPAFVLPSVTDPATLVDSRALAGKMYLLNVWGTWCGGCREEHAALLTIARTSGVPLVGIDWKDERAAAVQYLGQLGNPYQQVASDADGRVAIDWGVYGAPETFLVSAAGTVLEKHIGPLSEAVWQQKFAPHLTAGGGR